MGEQSVDLRSTLAILRRNRRTLLGAAALGAAAGVCSVVLWPPMYSSSSQVLLPQPTPDASGQTVTRDVATDVQIALSDRVLNPAGRTLSPPMDALTLTKQVEVKAPTTLLLEITGSAETPARAKAIARAVARSEVDFVSKAASSLTNAQEQLVDNRMKKLRASLATVNKEIKKTNARQEREDPASAEGRADATALAQLTAQQTSLVQQLDQLKDQKAQIQPSGGATIIEDASLAKRPGLAWRYLLFGLVGLVLALVVGAVGLVLVGRRDRRLHYRDEIADAVGSAVIASLRSRVPRTVAGWRTLLETYAPGSVDAWALRQALRQLVRGRSSSPGTAQQERAGEALSHPSSVTVLALSDDLRGLAVAPQLASYAASAGLLTRLVTAQRHDCAAALWAACSQPAEDEEVRPGLAVGTDAGDEEDVELTVVLAVLDRRRPEIADLPDTSVTVLALSAGSATAEELARAAVTADDAGLDITGIIVADPDDLDRTTGRLLLHERSQQVPLPTRLTGSTTPTSSRSSSSSTTATLRRRKS